MNYPHAPQTMATRGKKKEPLTEEQKNEIKEAFDLFDADGYGSYPSMSPID